MYPRCSSETERWETEARQRGWRQGGGEDCRKRQSDSDPKPPALSVCMKSVDTCCLAFL